MAVSSAVDVGGGLWVRNNRYCTQRARHADFVMEIVEVSKKDRLPYDIGAEAYRDRKLPEDNPYASDDWRHNEWWLGWSHSEESDQDESFDWATGKF